jgi:WD40 repeat protein
MRNQIILGALSAAALATGILSAANALLADAHTAPAIEAANSTKAATNVPKEVQRLKVKGYINAVAWNVDGSRLAALSEFGSVITLWETKTWTKLNEFRRVSGPYAFNSLEFLPDGTLLTANAGSIDKTKSYDDAYLADVKHNGENIAALGHFSLIQWNPETGTPLHYFPNVEHPSKDIPEHVGITDTFTVSKDGSLIAGINGWGMELYDAKGNLLRHMAIPLMPGHYKEFLEAVAFSPDGKELAVSNISGIVYFVSVADGSIVRSLTAFPQNQYHASALAYSSDGRFIATGKYKNHNVREPNNLSTYIWQVSDGQLIASLPGSTEPIGDKEEANVVRTMSWSPVGGILAVGDDGSLRIWSISESKQTLLLVKQMAHGTFCLSFSPQGVLAATDNNQVVIYK